MPARERGTAAVGSTSRPLSRCDNRDDLHLRRGRLVDDDRTGSGREVGVEVAAANGRERRRDVPVAALARARNE